MATNETTQVVQPTLPTITRTKTRISHHSNTLELYNQLHRFTSVVLRDKPILTTIAATYLVCKQFNKQLVCVTPQYGPVQGFLMYPEHTLNLCNVPGYRLGSENEAIVYVISHTELENRQVSACVSMPLLAKLEDVESVQQSILFQIMASNNGQYTDKFLMQVLTDGSWIMNTTQ